jgi:hypothetical protein
MKTVRLIIASLSLTVAGATFNSSQVSAATGTITSEISVDCVADDDADLNLWNYESETIAINHTNCDSFEWDDRNGEPISSSLVSPMVISSGDRLLLLGSIGDTRVSIDTDILFPARVPPGELQFTKELTIPANPRSFYAGPEDESNDHYLGGKRKCALESDVGERHVYNTLNITIVKGGRYTFRAVATDPLGGKLDNSLFHPIEDPFLALYSSFDSSNPDSNVIGCNDDLNDIFGYGDTGLAEVLSDGSWMFGQYPFFAADLEPGEYTLLLTTYDAISKADWLAGQGYREFTPGEASVTFELWGPPASLCLGSDPACNPTESTLPPTGSNQPAPIAIFAVLLAAAGILVIKIRRTA